MDRAQRSRVTMLVPRCRLSCVAAVQASRPCPSAAQLGCCPPLGPRSGPSACVGADLALMCRPSSAKKVICKFWWEGRCTKGAACPYAHGKVSLLSQTQHRLLCHTSPHEGSLALDACRAWEDAALCCVAGPLFCIL